MVLNVSMEAEEGPVLVEVIHRIVGVQWCIEEIPIEVILPEHQLNGVKRLPELAPVIRAYQLLGIIFQKLASYLQAEVAVPETVDLEVSLGYPEGTKRRSEESGINTEVVHVRSHTLKSLVGNGRVSPKMAGVLNLDVGKLILVQTGLQSNPCTKQVPVSEVVVKQVGVEEEKSR